MSYPADIPLAAKSYACVDALKIERSRSLPEETAVALVYGGSTEAVMMATPSDLEDFAVGFSFTEGFIDSSKQISDLKTVYNEYGVELRMWLTEHCEAKYRRRRRRMAGPTGCGLCGIDSLAEAVRPLRTVNSITTFGTNDISAAVAALETMQKLNHATRATHAAGFFRHGELVALREDVGRHNALDKLVGCLMRRDEPACEGAVVITSRVSIEMVQKTAALGAPVLIAISAPTSLAVRTAAAAGITLVARARGASFDVFTHPHRIEYSGATAA